VTTVVVSGSLTTFGALVVTAGLVVAVLVVSRGLSSGAPRGGTSGRRSTPRPLAPLSWLSGLSGPGGLSWLGGPGGRAGGPGAWASGAGWASVRDLRPLRARRRLGHDATDPEAGRLVLGTTLASWGRPTGKLLMAERAQSVTIVGPSQSGKTSCLAVPAILGWEGPVVAASVKTDLLHHTFEWRQRCGRVWCFDPVAVTGHPPSPWSPLGSAATWSGARRVAADLTEVARGRSASTSADADFWYATAAKLLAPLLLAAARGGRTMLDVVRWIDTQEVGEVMEILEASDVPDALQAAQANWLRDERQRSSIYTTAETVLEPFAERGMRSGTGSGHEVDVEQLLDGSHTLYMCAPAHDQRRLVGLFTALVKEVVQTAFTRSSRQGAPLDPPLLVVLDEAANIAPLAELDGLAATCAGHGVQLVTVWQDLAQVTARYGERGATVVNNHRAKVFLPGISDPPTLEHASRLAGEHERIVPSTTRDGVGAQSTTFAPVTRRLLPPEVLRCLRPGTGVLVYGTLPPAVVALCPWWRRRDLTGRAPSR
jgi:type IV secretion system protein VirD4